MDDLLEKLEELTTTIMERLYEVSYEELETFVESRQNLVDSIVAMVASCPPTPDQKVAINQILSHDSNILARMNALRLEAQDWLQKRNQAKTQRNAYENSYTPDSILMDRKK